MDWTDERRAAVSERMQRIWAQRSAEQKDAIFAQAGPKIAAALRGRKRSPEQKAHMRDAAVANRDNRVRAAQGSWAAKTPEERLARMRPAIDAGAAAVRGQPLKPEHLRRTRKTLARIRADPTIQQKRLEALRDATRSPEGRAQRGVISRTYWSALTPEQRAAHPWVHAGQEASFMRRPTRLERAIAAELDAMALTYTAQKRIGRYVVDFHLSAWDLVVECDGAYWHSGPERQARDDARDAYLRRLGCRVVRLPEAAIKADARQALRRGLASALARPEAI